jgi:uncharacterized protein (DUF1778 family)
MPPTPKVNATIRLTLEQLSLIDEAAAKERMSRAKFMETAVLEKAAAVRSE